MDPAGRHALVTGGGRGIGAAIARALTASGARVTVLGRDPAALAALVAGGAAAASVAADVTRPETLAAAFAAIPPVAILVNNAGAADSAPFAHTDRALWDRMIAINLTAAFETTRLALPSMRAAGWGRVINIASTAGLVGYRYASAYTASKHGLVGLTRALALELAATGITVNAICPGFTETALLAASIAAITEKTGRSEAEARRSLLAPNPQGRFIRPEEVAAAALYLCGPQSGAITGQALAVAGGEVM